MKYITVQITSTGSSYYCVEILIVLKRTHLNICELFLVFSFPKHHYTPFSGLPERIPSVPTLT